MYTVQENESKTEKNVHCHRTQKSRAYQICSGPKLGIKWSKQIMTVRNHVRTYLKYSGACTHTLEK